MSNKLYHTTRWLKLKKIKLDLDPLCAICFKSGRDEPANTVDHIIPHHGDETLFWDETNLQSLCASCHSSIKQTQEEYGYSQSAGMDGIPLDPNHPWNKGTKII